MLEQKGWLKYGGFAALIIIVAVLFVIGSKRQNDIGFCQEVFNGLLRGDPAIESQIDWENFQALHKDVGASYRQIQEEKLQKVYRKAFIAGCALTYKYSKMSLQEFSNWRIQEQDEEKAIVAADYPRFAKVLLFTISKIGGRKLISIQWAEQIVTGGGGLADAP